VFIFLKKISHDRSKTQTPEPVILPAIKN